MTLIIALALGVIAGAVFVGFVCFCVIIAAQRSVDRRMGYIDLIEATREGRAASADSHRGTELSGGRTSPPPTHLRLIRDNGSTEVLIPLDEDD